MESPIRSVVVVSMVGCLGLVACGSPNTMTTTDAGGDAQAAVRAASSQIAAAFCGQVSACCAAYSQTLNTEGCRDDVLVPALLDPADVAFYGASLVAENLPACVAAAKAYAQSCGDADSHRAYLAACRPVFSGPVPIGQTCTGTLACAQPTDGLGYSYCQQVHANEPTVCLVHLPPTEGAACAVATPSYADCSWDPTLYCSTLTWTCKKKGAVNEPCTDTGGCVSGAYCGVGLVCHAQGAVGQDCGGYQDGCSVGVCNGSTKFCEPPACQATNSCPPGTRFTETFCL